MNRVLATAMAATLPLVAAAGPEDALSNFQAPVAGKAAAFSFGGENNHEFMLDGKPFQIRGAEMHPQRIPRQHWRQRIQAAKAMGLNTITFYPFWNELETKDGGWDFSGNKDIAAFIDLCAEEGMWVFFRPGPYVCGEWDFGGLPTRFLKQRKPKLRSSQNPEYMKETERYMEKMAEIAVPRLCKNGGPILMLQLENEYGSYKVPHADMPYMQWLKDFWTAKGAGPFYVSEGTTLHHLRFVPAGVAIGLDPMGEDPDDLPTARSVSPNVPVFSSETYPGWLRHWREGNWISTPETLDVVRQFMQDGTSFSLYVLHGGSNFGLSAGANEDARNGFQPDLTSYDYGSPIGEHGNYAPEYYRYREMISEALPKGSVLPDVPQTPPSMEVAPFTPQRIGYLKPSAAVACSFDTPPTFEQMDQNQGMAAYTCKVPAGRAAWLGFEAHDYVQVFLGDKESGEYRYIGTVDRTIPQYRVPGLGLPARDKEMNLLLLADSFGHVNFSAYMEQDNKGVVSDVRLGHETLRNWSFLPVPLDGNPEVIFNPANFSDKDSGLRGAGFRAEIELDKVADTFFDMSKWQKGYLWVNGHLLGRYWNVGPQLRLYCPAEWLKKGKNEIYVLETIGKDSAPIRGCTERNTEVDKATHNANNVW